MDAQASREASFGQALVGPHRDEMEMTLAGRDIRRFASSGQQRAALLALKLAKVDLFRRRRGETPVLLVDDIDTEIDRKRLLRFLEHVGGRAQSVLTSSKRDLFGSPPKNARFYHVERGLLTPLTDAC
jgi:DNA replication and repair protein RecF